MTYLGLTPRRTSTQRLFFALWPDATVRQQLAACNAALGAKLGKAIPAQNLHLTLAFLGAVTASQRKAMLDAASDIRLAHFDLRLDTLGYWSRPRIVWLGSKLAPPPALLQIVSALRQALPAAGLVADARAFQVHVSLRRKLLHRPLLPAVEAVFWPVQEFVLVESELGSTGSVYTIIQRWALEAEAGQTGR